MADRRDCSCHRHVRVPVGAVRVPEKSELGSIYLGTNSARDWLHSGSYAGGANSAWPLPTAEGVRPGPERGCGPGTTAPPPCRVMILAESSVSLRSDPKAVKTTACPYVIDAA